MKKTRSPWLPENYQQFRVAFDFALLFESPVQGPNRLASAIAAIQEDAHGIFISQVVLGTNGQAGLR